jgi:hypothetical protein
VPAKAPDSAAWPKPAACPTDQFVDRRDLPARVATAKAFEEFRSAGLGRKPIIEAYEVVKAPGATSLAPASPPGARSPFPESRGVLGIPSPATEPLETMNSCLNPSLQQDVTRHPGNDWEMQVADFTME